MSGMELFGWAVGFLLGLMVVLYGMEWALGEMERWWPRRRR